MKVGDSLFLVFAGMRIIILALHATIIHISLLKLKAPIKSKWKDDCGQPLARNMEWQAHWFKLLPLLSTEENDLW